MTLVLIAEKSQETVLLELQAALEQDLLLRRKQGYTFAHDHVQQAAYALIPDDEKQIVHLEIGRHLLAVTPEAELAESIFSIVDHINAGLELITKQQEKGQLAELNLLTGKRAKASAAYRTALNYLLTALRLLGDNPWDRHYALTLSIHEEAAEVAFFNQNHELVDNLFKTTIQKAKTVLDKVSIYKTRIQAYTDQLRAQQAIELSRGILGQLGMNFPAKPNRLQLLKVFGKIHSLLWGKSLNKIANLPKASDAKAIAAMSICDLLYPAAGLAGNFAIWVIAVKKQVELQLKYGNYSTFSYMAWAVILIKSNRIQEGYRFAELSIKLDLSKDTNVAYSYYGMCMPWKKPIQEATEKLLQVYHWGLQNGNFEMAKLSLGTHYLYKFLTGNNLAELEQ